MQIDGDGVLPDAIGFGRRTLGLGFERAFGATAFPQFG